MKKKIYLAVLAAVVALTASACGNNATTENAASQSKTEQADKKENGNKKGQTRLVSVKDLDKYVKLGAYKGIALDKVVRVVSDSELQLQIDENLMNDAKEISEPAQMGDMVTINFVGTKDGVAFDGGTANNFDMTLGAGGMIAGFEDGIVGMKKGETKDLNLTFPEEYPEPSLEGEDVVFKITCQKVRRKAELTDKWVASQGDFKTVEEYRESIRKTMEEEAQKMADADLKSVGWNQVLESSEVLEFPQKDIDAHKEEYKKMVELYASQAQMELEKFVESQNMTMEQLEADMQMYAEIMVKQNLVIQAILDAENISLEDKECLEIQEQLIQELGYKDLAELIDKHGQEKVDATIGLLRVEEFIAKHAEINEKANGGDTTGENADAVTSDETSTPDTEGEVDKELEEDADDVDPDEETVVVE